MNSELIYAPDPGSTIELSFTREVRAAVAGGNCDLQRLFRAGFASSST
jgi:hypothetical protein